VRSELLFSFRIVRVYPSLSRFSLRIWLLEVNWNVEFSASTEDSNLTVGPSCAIPGFDIWTLYTRLYFQTKALVPSADTDILI